MSINLLPCPFCGGKALFHWSLDKEIVNVRCENWKPEVCLGAGANCWEEAEAAAAWNKRSLPSTPECPECFGQGVEPNTHGRRVCQGCGGSGLTPSSARRTVRGTGWEPFDDYMPPYRCTLIKADKLGLPIVLEAADGSWWVHDPLPNPTDNGSFNVNRTVCPYLGNRCPTGHCWRWSRPDGGGSHCTKWLDPAYEAMSYDDKRAAEKREADLLLKRKSAEPSDEGVDKHE